MPAESWRGAETRSAAALGWFGQGKRGVWLGEEVLEGAGRGGWC